MTVLKRSTSGRSGGGGARYKCPNSPHPKCPKCGKAMQRNFYYDRGELLRYRDDKWHCFPCEQEKTRLVKSPDGQDLPIIAPDDVASFMEDLAKEVYPSKESAEKEEG